MSDVTQDGFEPAQAQARVSRDKLAREPVIWRVHGVMLIVFAVATGILGFALPTASSGPMLAFAGLLGLGGGIFLTTRPPRIGTVENHLALASIYGFIGLGQVAYAPDWRVPLGTAMFAGTLIAMRLKERRQIIGHLLAATVCIVGPALTQTTDGEALAGIAAIVAVVWALTAVCTLLLEATEAQGLQLETLLRRDPLTGAGNARLLRERLDAQLARHAEQRRPLALLAVDLTEFTELNDAFGRTACDELLARAAAAIDAVLPASATLTRPVDDEFWVLLPETDAAGAQDTVAELRWALARVGMPGTGTGLAAAVGVASYPADAVGTAVLEELARERMASDRERGHYELPLLPTRIRPAAEPAGLPAPAAVRGLSRRQFAQHPVVWTCTLAVYAVVVAVTAASAFSAGTVLRGDGVLLCALLVCGALLLRRRSPAVGGLRSHLYVASVSGSGAVGLWALQPDPSIAIAFSMFVGPLIAVRLQTRHGVYAHLAVMSAAFAAVAVVGGIGGDLTRESVLQITVLIPSTWAIGLSCMVALWSAEMQGRELEALVRTDPVTGVGNRILLGDRLAEELPAHAAAGDALAIVVVELIETFENSRAASELLLRAAAATITASIGPHDTCIRRRGHEFIVILPRADEDAVAHSCAALRAGLADLARRGHRALSVHAVARYPADAATPEGLLAAADVRLVASRAVLLVEE